MTTAIAVIVALGVGFAAHFFYAQRMGGKVIKISVQNAPGRKKGD